MSGCLIGLSKERGEPAFHFGDRFLFPLRVGLQLVAADAPDVEVFGIRVGEVETGYGAGRVHRFIFGEGDAGALGSFEEVEEGILFGMVGRGGIAGSGADAAVLFGDQVLGAQFVGLFVAPLEADLLVEVLGIGLGEAVADSLDEDGGIVVVLFLVGTGDLVGLASGSDSEGSHVVELSTIFGSDKIATTEGEGPLFGGLLALLAEEVEPGEDGGAVLVGIEFDRLADGIGGPEAKDRFGLELVVVDQLLENSLAVLEEFSCLFAVFFVVEDFGEDPLQFPCPEEGRPIDIGDEVLDRKIVNFLKAEGGGPGNVDR